MKRFLILISIFLPLLLAAQNQSKIEIDANSLKPLHDKLSSEIQSEPISYDASERLCARLKIYINKLPLKEITSVSLIAADDETTVVKQIIRGDRNYIIADVTSGENRSFVLAHEKYGLSDTIKLNIKSNKVYLLEAKAYIFHTVTINYSPANAIVKIDQTEYTNHKGSISIRLSSGFHNYTISAPDHNEESGILTVEQNLSLSATLIPTYGWINISGENELDKAYVYIDGKYVGRAPLTSNKLPRGVHKIRIVQDMYKEYEAEVTVKDNTRHDFAPTLEPNFANVTIMADVGSSIFINDEYMGITPWKGKLLSGKYTIVAKKSNYHNSSVTKNIEPNLSNQYIILPSAEPILGSVEIKSRPKKANIYIDNKFYSEKSPFKSNIITGTHTLTVSKDGYETYERSFYISEGNTTHLTPNLTKVKKSRYRYFDLEDWDRFNLGITADLAWITYDNVEFGLGVGLLWRMFYYDSWCIPTVGINYMYGFGGSHSLSFPVAFNFNWAKIFGDYIDCSVYSGLGLDPTYLDIFNINNTHNGIEYRYTKGWCCGLTFNVLGMSFRHHDINFYIKSFLNYENSAVGLRYSYMF